MPLGIIMTRIQDRTLSSGLHDRVIVLLDSLATGTKAYLPTQDVLQLSYLPDQKDALPEAKYATITGMPSDGSENTFDYVWATNDATITNTLNDSGNKLGLYKLDDPEVKEIINKVNKLNDEAVSQIGSISQTISELNIEGKDSGTIIGKRGQTLDAIQYLTSLDDLVLSPRNAVGQFESVGAFRPSHFSEEIGFVATLLDDSAIEFAVIKYFCHVYSPFTYCSVMRYASIILLLLIQFCNRKLANSATFFQSAETYYYNRRDRNMCGL